MKSKEPERLTNERYLGKELPLQMYAQVISKPIEMHWHEFYELCFIRSGRGTNVVNGERVPLQPGSLFLLTPADFHEIYSDRSSPPMELYNVVFSEELLTEELRDLLLAERSVCSIQVEPSRIAVVEGEYKLIESELLQRSTGRHILIKGALERIVIGWLRGLERLERLERAEGPEEGPEGLGRLEGPEGLGGPGRLEGPGGPGRLEVPEGLGRLEVPEGLGRLEVPGRLEGLGGPEGPEGLGRLEVPGGPGGLEESGRREPRRQTKVEKTHANTEETGAQPSASLMKALNYIRHHFREPIMLEDAARQARLAPNYFSDCFRKATGVSFQHYLQELRISFARSLLRASSLPVTDICYASGFRTLTHFERVFKQRYGQTPRAFRKEAAANG